MDEREKDEETKEKTLCQGGCWMYYKVPSGQKDGLNLSRRIKNAQESFITNIIFNL